MTADAIPGCFTLHILLYGIGPNLFPEFFRMTPFRPKTSGVISMANDHPMYPTDTAHA